MNRPEAAHQESTPASATTRPEPITGASMRFSTTTGSTAPDGWDDFCKAHEGTIYQSTHYAEYVRSIGMSPRFIQVAQNGETKAQLLVIESSRPFQLLYDWPLAALTLKVARHAFAEDRFTYGPVYSDEPSARAAVEEAVRRAKKAHARLSGSHGPMRPEGGIFENTGLKSRPWATFLIDLTQPLDVLWQNVDKAARKIVNRTREDGVSVREAQDTVDVKHYHRMLNEGRKRNGVRPYAFKGNAEFYDVLVKNGRAKILLAEKDGHVLAGLGITEFNGVIHEWGAGQSGYALENKIYASDLIKWHVIEWGHQNGKRTYDLTGVNPNPQDAKEQGIFRFKQKWGGVLKNYPEYQS